MRKLNYFNVSQFGGRKGVKDTGVSETSEFLASIFTTTENFWINLINLLCINKSDMTPFYVS